MSPRQKRTLKRALLAAGVIGPVILTILALSILRSASTRATPANKTEQALKRRAFIENAEWMAPGIPMTRRLEMLANDRSRLFKYWVLPEQIANLERMLAAEKFPEKRVTLLARITSTQLGLGRTDAALETIERAVTVIRENRIPIDSGPAQEVRWWQGIAYMRQGEQDNCVGNHTAESCIVPIRGAGIYKNRRGPDGAIRAYTAYLEADPGDLGARWLLNLAHMNRGDWPQAVPSQWLVSPDSFESGHDVGRFANIAPAVGLDRPALSGGSILEDFDHDGFLDLVVSAYGIRDQLRYYHNDGDGRFTEQTDQAGLDGLFGGLNMVHADYDNDGWADIYVIRGAWQGITGRHPDSLLHNDGPDPRTGIVTFTDVTEEAGVLAFYPSQTAAWGDYDNDGWLDLFVGSEGPEKIDYPCLLFRNNGRDPVSGRVTFSEVAAETGLQHRGYVKGVVWGDYNNDGLLDLYVSQLEKPNVLYRNDGASAEHPGAWHFSDVTAQAGVGKPISSFPTLWFDYDNDGWLDLLATSRTARDTSDSESSKTDPLAMIVAYHLGESVSMELPCLYRNNRDGSFTNVTEAMGLARPLYGMGLNFGDLDNDGWLDFYVGTGNPNLTTLVPNLMFRNDGGRKFQDVTTSGGFGNLQKGHGIAWGDIDNDGDQDIFEELGAAWPADVASSALFLNPGHSNRWLTIRLEGVVDNEYGIGARIKVTVQNPDGGVREIHRTVGTGGSFGSSSLQEEIGLGAARRILRVQIDWPAEGASQIVTDVPMDRVIHVRQGDLEARAVSSRKISMPLAGALEICHHHDPVVQ